jgi:aminomuconate-semialdehyde/2-hydroxymuconate-6-semialdehyde dehydrogenase
MTLTIHNTIGNKQTAAHQVAWLDVFNPATGELCARCPDSNQTDIEAAVIAARKAFPSWSRLSNTERSSWLNKLADALEKQINDFALAETNNSGKPLALSRDIEMPRAVENLRFFAAAASQFSSESHHGQAGWNVTTHSPLGIVSCISPWNLPLYLFTWKIAPALAAGNCVIAKPSEITPVTAAMLGELAQKIGFPEGVLNIVHGLGNKVGQALVEHPDVKAISFTGSTAVGKKIAEHCGPALKKVSLELGGKNPTIIFADAPRKNLIDTLMRSAFQNSGQICLCGSRILIEKSVYKEIRDELVARAKQLRVGDPLDAKTQMGSMISKPHFDKVISHIELAKAEGGELLCGGNTIAPSGRCEQGWFIAPTVFENLGPYTRTNQEEIFGPVVTLQAFDDETDAIALANASEYGLAASIWTSDIRRAHHVANAVECGIIWINTWLQRDLRTPFGGMKQSGLGREGGLDAMRFFTETKNICLDLG